MNKRRLLAAALSVALSVTALATLGSPASAVSDSPSTDRARTQQMVSPHQLGDATPKSGVNTVTAKPKAFAAPNTTVTSPTGTMPPGTDIPAYGVQSLILDETDSHVFLQPMNSYALMSTDLAGGNLTSMYQNRGLASMVLDEPNHRLYALLTSPYQLAVIDTTTLTQVNVWDLYSNAQVSRMAYASGQVWFYDYYLAGTVDATQIQAIDVATGAHTSVSVPGVTSVSSVFPVPGQADTIGVEATTASGSVSAWYTASGTALTAGPTEPSDCGTQFTVDASHLLCSGTLKKASDFSADGTYATTFGTPTTATNDAIAYGLDACGTNMPILDVVRNGQTSPTRSYMGSYQEVQAAAYTQDGSKLYAVTQTPCGTMQTPQLRVIDNPNRTFTTLTLTVPAKTKVGAKASVTGTLAFVGENYSGSHTVHVTRTDRTGVHPLADVVPDSTGHFSVSDSATPLGLSTYTVTFDADTTHDGATVSTGTTREVPWDVNGDGYADAVVGAPGEDVSTHTDTGSVTVMYGHSGGVTGTGSVAFDQDTPGVPGANESGDFLGYTSASGDFNHDGYPDVAVTATGEDINGGVSDGAIWVLYGSANGLKYTGIQMITMANTNLGLRDDSWFGEPMAVGDYNGDGLDDIAASTGDSETIVVMYGTPNGIETNGNLMSYLQPGYNGAPEAQYQSLWGWSLAAGDINGDGVSDLAIGTPYDYTDTGYSVGSVGIVYGSKTYGLGNASSSGTQRFAPTTSGVPGTAHTFVKGTDAPDSFGWNVVLADFNGDGKDDLAVSAPGTPVTNTSKHEDAGTLTVLLSNGSRITTTGSALITQDSSYMPGSPAKGDWFGDTIAAGDTNSNGKVDLAVYSPGDGYVTVIRGGSTGLSLSTAKGWTQNSSGVPGTTETGDWWGDSIRFGYFKGAGQPAAMMVGADGENSSQGSVTFIYGTTSSGLTGTGSTSFNQNSSGVPGTAENGDYFGSYFNN